MVVETVAEVINMATNVVKLAAFTTGSSTSRVVHRISRLVAVQLKQQVLLGRCPFW